jgi:uncharacterized protein YggE
MGAFVEVSGTGSAAATPDVVRLDVAVRCEADHVAAALRDAADRAAALSQAARDHGVAPRDIQTTGSGVHPRHDREGATVVGYTAYQSTRLSVREPERMGDLVAAFAGVAGNALTIDRIALEIGDPEPVLRAAREAAFTNAEDKAEQYAALAGRRLGRVAQLTDLPSGGPATARYELVAASGTDTDLGENTVTATVAVRWEWE